LHYSLDLHLRSVLGFIFFQQRYPAFTIFKGRSVLYYTWAWSWQSTCVQSRYLRTAHVL